MRVISYSLFNDDPKYFKFYLRGLYFNLRMARLLYPDWTVMLHYSMIADSFDQALIEDMKLLFGFFYDRFTHAKRCESMMQRFKPAFIEKAEYIICRDLDSVHTWREAKEVDKWVKSGKDAHGINDNPAHSIPLMGGMCGFKAEVIKNNFKDWNDLISGYDLSQHGSDQTLLMQKVYPIVKDSFYHSNLKNREPQPDNNHFWESDLISRYIGSAGVIDMELLRFFDRHDIDNNKYQGFEKEHSEIFYWHL